MANGSKKLVLALRRLSRFVVVVAIDWIVLGGNQLAVAEESVASKPAGPISFTFQNDFTTAYIFRGMLQERDGFIWQPSIGVSLAHYQSAQGIVQDVTVAIGYWNSVHSEDTLHSGNGPKALYESDYYPSISATWAGGITSALTYYFYTSPNGAFTTIEEATLSFSLDDEPFLGAFSVHPNLTFGFETKGTSFYDYSGVSDGGHGRGDAVILAGGPIKILTLPGYDSYPFTVTVPVALGLSMHDYFDDGIHNDVFGYATIGLNVAVPLAFLSERYGEWSVVNGLNVWFLDKALENANQGDEVYPVWTSTLAMTY